ncbi:Zinc finger CCCH domain-containing protein 20 [Morella rubra]|uniref:Zinc finger CCCH domain-containing protein 20 n=1 Tax=Morella rubra TaxID=262757 RepID=A0A6A1W642_9ROSI|nr:Zinc finger CCCH domain-containing protein 20 [Morella rubra]
MMIRNPTVQVPPWDWDPFENLTTGTSSPFSPTSPSFNFNGNAGGGDHSPFLDSFTALQRYLPSNQSDSLTEESDVPVDAFSCDHFRMYEFKVRMCTRARSHDWTECPYAHPGEKARRRDPRKYLYSGTACPDFRRGSCKKGDSCEFAHGVFECWLHPARYRTQPCKDGPSCQRRVCFFAHSTEQLRVLTQQSPRGGESFDGSSIRHGFDSYLTPELFVSSPTSILASPPISPPSDSPPTSPSGIPIGGRTANSVSDLVSSTRNLQLGKLRMSPPPWGLAVGSGFCSPRGSTLRPGFCSLSPTPSPTPTRSGLRSLDNQNFEEPPMERVESGRDLRAQMYAKLSKENSLGRVDSAPSDPDVGWVSELLK